MRERKKKGTKKKKLRFKYECINVNRFLLILFSLYSVTLFTKNYALDI